MKNLGTFMIWTLLFLSATNEVLGAIPFNTLSYPVLQDKNLGPETVTETEFHQVLQTLHKIYAPVVKARGGFPLVIKGDWQSSVVNAYATRELDAWNIHVSGGIARAKGMTKDSLALVVCHELGHHLGGAPRTYLFGGWPSAEGQADYWASSKCLKKYYAELHSEEISVENNIPEKVLIDCSSLYSKENQINICVKSLLATGDFSEFLNTLPTTRYLTSLTGRDIREVKGTNTNDYPRAQCRIDTLYQGTLCTIGADVVTSETDAKVGHCNGHVVGARPLCWYRP